MFLCPIQISWCDRTLLVGRFPHCDAELVFLMLAQLLTPSSSDAVALGLTFLHRGTLMVFQQLASMLMVWLQRTVEGDSVAIPSTRKTSAEVS
jgi:hypothetical protein